MTSRGRANTRRRVPIGIEACTVSGLERTTVYPHFAEHVAMDSLQTGRKGMRNTWACDIKVDLCTSVQVNLIFRLFLLPVFASMRKKGNAQNNVVIYRQIITLRLEEPSFTVSQLFIERLRNGVTSFVSLLRCTWEFNFHTLASLRTCFNCKFERTSY